jgi:Tfp pilus assembly protein PilO
MKRLSPREQRVVLLLVLLAVPILWLYAGFLGGLWRRLGDAGGQLKATREELRGLEAVVANETALKEQEQQVQQTVVSLRALLPGENELPAAIERLSDLATQTQVKIQTIYPHRPVSEQTGSGEKGRASAAAVYKEIPIQIDAICGFHQLGTFLSMVESDTRPMRVANLRISGNPKDPKRHMIKLLLRSYFATKGSSESKDGRES